MAYSEEYFIHVQGAQKGPYTYPQLKRLYDNNLIPEETLYWQDGMEQLQPVSDLCGAGRRERQRRAKRLRVTAGALAVVVVLVLAYCAPVLKDGWREMNERACTPEGAYWKARGFVREEVKAQEESVAFEPFAAASVALTGTEAAVVLPGVVYGKDGTGVRKSWKVAMRFDAKQGEWRLPER